VNTPGMNGGCVMLHKTWDIYHVNASHMSCSVSQ